MSKVVDIFQEMVKIGVDKFKSFFFELEKGQAMRRTSKPETREEALGLGQFGPQANMGLSLLITIQGLLNNITKQVFTIGYKMHQEEDYTKVLELTERLKISNLKSLEMKQIQEELVVLQAQLRQPTPHVTLSELAENIAIASGSKGALRVSKAFEALGQIKPTVIMPDNKFSPLQPMNLSAPEAG